MKICFLINDNIIVCCFYYRNSICCHVFAVNIPLWFQERFNNILGSTGKKMEDMLIDILIIIADKGNK